MGAKYTAVMDAQSVAAVCELFAITAPADAAVVIHEVWITQDTIEVSEQLPINIFRTATAQAAKGTANTPAPLEVGSPACGTVVRTNILAAETLATETTMLHRISQNLLVGWQYLPTPECRIVISPSGVLCIKLDAVPAGATVFSGFVIFEEIGG